jgi:hypothetical protein
MLPKIEHPIHTIKIPSMDKEFKFRPFLVKEEKLLLIAKESEEPTDILVAIKQIVTNCCLDELDTDELTIFDLEYTFLKIRSFSVDNIVNISFRDVDDGQLYDFEIDLDTIKVVFPKQNDPNIKIDDNSGFIMKYPSAALYSDDTFLDIEKEHMFELIIRCVKQIYNGDEVYDSEDLSPEEIGDFLEALDLKTFSKVQEFLSNSPTMKHELFYTDSSGIDKKIVLRSLNDFFSWR